MPVRGSGYRADVTLHLPRSVRLAIWWSARPPAPGTDAVDAWVRRTVRAVEADDEPHTVRAVTGEVRALRGHLTELAAASGGAVALLPVAGAPGPIPAAAAGAAISAGECVLFDLSLGASALVPHLTRFGSDLDSGHRVEWEEIAVPPWRSGFAAHVGTVADAERSLRGTLAAAATTLEALDLARSRPELGEALARIREPALLDRALPPTADSRRAALLALGVRVRTVVELAGRDDGAAVTAGQADRRRAALLALDEAARRAIAAATAVPGPRESAWVDPA